MTATTIPRLSAAIFAGIGMFRADLDASLALRVEVVRRDDRAELYTLHFADCTIDLLLFNRVEKGGGGGELEAQTDGSGQTDGEAGGRDPK